MVGCLIDDEDNDKVVNRIVDHVVATVMTIITIVNVNEDAQEAMMTMDIIPDLSALLLSFAGHACTGSQHSQSLSLIHI